MSIKAAIWIFVALSIGLKIWLPENNAASFASGAFFGMAFILFGLGVKARMNRGF